MKKYKSYILGGSMVLIVLVLWQTASDTGLFGKYEISRGKLMLPSPLFVFQRFWELLWNGYLLKHIWVCGIGASFRNFYGKKQKYKNVPTAIV